MRKLNGLKLDLNSISMSIIGELITDYPFEGVIGDKRLFASSLSKVIKEIITDEITNKGSKYLISKYPTMDIEDRLLELSEKFIAEPRWRDVFRKVVTNNYYFEATLMDILDTIPVNHFDIWIIEYSSGLGKLVFINDIRVIEWEELTKLEK